MIPVDQTRFGDEGNCLAACICSLLEIPLDESLRTHGHAWGINLAEFLKPRGLAYVEMWCGSMVREPQDEPVVPGERLGWQPIIFGAPWPLGVLGGPSPRYPGINHAVVGRTNGYGFEVLHDPHPDRTGIPYVTHVGFLVPIEGNAV